MFMIGDDSVSAFEEQEVSRIIEVLSSLEFVTYATETFDSVC